MQLDSYAVIFQTDMHLKRDRDWIDFKTASMQCLSCNASGSGKGF